MKRLKQTLNTLLRLLLVVVGAKLMLVDAKADGCYCRVASISLSTNWWKMGFINPGWLTNPPEVYFQRTTITGISVNDSIFNGNDISGIAGSAAAGVSEKYDSDHFYTNDTTYKESADYRTTLKYEDNMHWDWAYTNRISTLTGINFMSGIWNIIWFPFPNARYGYESESGAEKDEAYLNARSWFSNISGNIYNADWLYVGPRYAYQATATTELSVYRFDCQQSVFDWNYPANSPAPCHHAKRVEAIYNSPFTDALLAKKISSLMARQTWPTNWVHSDLVVATYLFWDTNHITASGKKSFYRPEVPDSQTNVTYTLQWEQVTQVVANNTTNTTRQLMGCQIIGTGDKVNPAIYDPPFFVDVPLAGNTTVYITAPEIVTPSSPLVPGSGL